MGKTLVQRLLDAGYPKDQMFHHCSDLYIFATPLTRQVIEKWAEDNGWHLELVRQKSFLFSTFIDQITGRTMYDIAFQYVPYWEEVAGNALCKEDL